MNITSVSISIRKWLFIWTKYCTDSPEFQLVECSDEELPKKVAEAERNVENLTVVPADLAFNFLYNSLSKQHALPTDLVICTRSHGCPLRYPPTYP